MEIERLSGSQFDPDAVNLFNSEEGVLRDMVAQKCFIPEQGFKNHDKQQ